MSDWGAIEEALIPVLDEFGWKAVEQALYRDPIWSTYEHSKPPEAKRTRETDQ